MSNGFSQILTFPGMENMLLFLNLPKGKSIGTGCFNKGATMGPKEITKDIYLVGGADITRFQRLSCIPGQHGDEMILIDAGAGRSVDGIAVNVRKLGLDPGKISTIILTHCHIDHIGGAREFRERFGLATHHAQA